MSTPSEYHAPPWAGPDVSEVAHFRKGEATAGALRRLLSRFPDDATVRITTYWGGQAMIVHVAGRNPLWRGPRRSR
jgi:hypothetical protein